MVSSRMYGLPPALPYRKKWEGEQEDDGLNVSTPSTLEAFPFSACLH
jgi:hypothetical protein